MPARLTHEEAAKVMIEAGVEPLEDYTSALTPWRCRCMTCAKEVRPRYNSVQQGQGACKYCSGQAIDEADAVAFIRERGFKPVGRFKGTNTAWEMRHLECGNTVANRLTHLQQGRRGCKFCSRKYIPPEEIAEDLRRAEMTPLEAYRGVNQAWRCRHIPCGKEVSPSLAHIRHRGSGCKFCCRRAVDPEDAEAFARGRGMTPLGPYPGSDRPWPMRHNDCGREVSPSYHNLRDTKNPCRYCGAAEVHPDDAAAVWEELGLTPSGPFPGSNEPWPSVHTCGQAVNVTWLAVVHGGSPGCRSCFPQARGYDRTRPGVLYVAQHQEFEAFKIGVSNVRSAKFRIRAHESNGWRVVEVWEFEDGESPPAIERSVIESWRSRGYGPAVIQVEMPQGGYTETVDARHFSMREVLEVVAEHR